MVTELKSKYYTCLAERFPAALTDPDGCQGIDLDHYSTAHRLNSIVDSPTHKQSGPNIHEANKAIIRTVHQSENNMKRL